jgi:ABC-type phosphate transport system substrate-binding protein
MKTNFKTLFLLIALVGTQYSYAQVMVVVSAKSNATNLSKDQASALFLGKSTQLPGAGIPVLIDQPETSEIRKVFYTKVTEKNSIQVKAIWSRLVFAGKGTIPKEVSSNDEVKKLLATNPDAVGYIDKSAVDTTVKVLLAIE